MPRNEWNDENRMEVKLNAFGLPRKTHIWMSSNIYVLIDVSYMYLRESTHEWRRRNTTYGKKP